LQGFFFAAGAVEALTPPSSLIVNVQRNGDAQLLVSWTDWADEVGYQIFSTTLRNPGPLFDGSQLGIGWRLEAELPANTTTKNVLASGGRMFIVCARAGSVPATSNLIVGCTLTSNYVIPALPNDGARINALSVTQTGRTFLEVTWTESFSTARSEVRISPSGQSVVNDVNETHRFENLNPGTVYTVEACAQNNEQIANGTESCRSLNVSTKPDPPVAVNSVELISPASSRSQTVRFRHNNRSQNRAHSFLVRLFPSNSQTLLIEKRVNARLGQVTYEETFTNLTPFTSYDVSVIPFNVSGVGSAYIVDFTTTNEVIVEAIPISGNSSLLRFNALALGDYIVETRDTLGGYSEVGRLRVRSTGLQRIVVDGVNEPKTMRLRWNLAHYNAVSNNLIVAGKPGSPELVSATVSRAPRDRNTEVSVSFRPLVEMIRPLGTIGYTLVADQVLDESVAPERSVVLAFLSLRQFRSGELQSIRGSSTLRITNIRVCRVKKPDLQVIRTSPCSAETRFATDGIMRVP